MNIDEKVKQRITDAVAMSAAKREEQAKTISRIEEQLFTLQKAVEYNSKLLEQLIDLIPSRAPDKKVQDLLKIQMGTLRPLFEKANFDGKEQLLGMMDNLFGGQV